MVDAGAGAYYVSHQMNLLLLLSALLSALTGVGARVAGPEPVQAVAQEKSIGAVAKKAARRLLVRPPFVLPQIAVVAHAIPIAPFSVVGTPPWVSRRRE